jgi:LacI family transcriptional regulator
MSKQKVNIKDVAAAAKVHPSTVSRVLNPATRGMVSENVAKRITDIADRLGYARSSLASGLRTGKSYTVGVIIPDLTNPVFPPVVRGIERALGVAGYIAILADSDNSARSERAIFDSMRSRRVDGLILATAHRQDPIVSACVSEQLPVVLVNRTVDSDKVTAVINNDELGIELAVSHLVDLGHRDIAFLGGPEDTTTGRDRRAAFEKLARVGRFNMSSDNCISCDSFTEEAGHKSMLSILNGGGNFSAVVAANDLLALGCYDALAERGLTCPTDISVTGFNDMPFMNRLSPPLTTIHIPLDELGTRAAELLIEEMRDGTTASETLRLDPTLVVRGSTARLTPA